MTGVLGGLLGSYKKASPVYVGGKTAANVTSTSLTNLSGGLASAPSAGDLVIVALALGVNAGTVSNLSVTGYTQAANLASTDTSGDNLYFYVGYKYLTGADTTVSFVNSNTTESSVVVHVWRGVSSSSPLDVSARTAIAASARPAYPSITPVTEGSIIISTVAIGSDTAAASWTNASLLNVLSAAVPTTSAGQESHVGIGSDIWTTGTYSIPTWTSSDTDFSYSSAAVTLALRPA